MLQQNRRRVFTRGFRVMYYLGPKEDHGVKS